MSLRGSSNDDSDSSLHASKNDIEHSPKLDRYASLGPKRRPPRRLPVATEESVHKYERLEDLLREAGYKETRIFTPEGTPEPDSKRHLSGHGDNAGSRVGTVVGFLSSFVGGGGSSRPPSRMQKPISPLTPSPSPPPRTSHKRNTLAPSTPPSPLHSAHGQMRVTTARHERPVSQAHAYLKHMASVPNLPRRSKSTITPRNSNGRMTGVNMEGDPHPPMPTSWLETVARAVLFGGEDAHIGRPKSPPLFTISPTSPTTGERSPFYSKRTSPHGLGSDMHSSFYSTSSQATSSHSAGRGRSLDVQIGGGKLTLGETRAAHCQSTVCMTQVTCRSAPTSRASSRARRERKRKQELEVHEPPSLAKTRTEGDVWGADDLPSVTKPNKRHHQLNIGQRYISGLSHGSSSHSEDSSDSSEGEGELTLDRILLPSKRQNSIRSLRRHLTLKDSISDLRRSIRPPTPDVNEEDEDEEDRDRTWTRFTNGGRQRCGVPRWN